MQDTTQTDNLVFFMPMTLEKGKGSHDREVTKIRGIASTKSEDSDKEILDPNGFNLKPFLKSGFFNYGHNPNPAFLVGEPTDAYVKDNNLHVEGILYPQSIKAQEIITAMKVLESDSKSRNMGLSIEGKVIERDKKNPSYVTKAEITGVAITTRPKNPSTLLELVKGDKPLFVEPVFDPSAEPSTATTTTTTMKPAPAPTVTTTGDNSPTDQSTNTGPPQPTVADTGAGVAKSSDVGDAPSPVAAPVTPPPSNSSKADTAIGGQDKKLTKSDVYVEIFRKYTTNVNDAGTLFNLIKSINEMNGDTQITNKTLQDLQSLINLAKGMPGANAASNTTTPPDANPANANANVNTNTNADANASTAANGGDGGADLIKDAGAPVMDTAQSANLSKQLEDTIALLKKSQEQNVAMAENSKKLYEDQEKRIAEMKKSIDDMGMQKTPGRSLLNKNFFDKGKPADDKPVVTTLYLSKDEDRNPIIKSIETAMLGATEAEQAVLKKAVSTFEISGYFGQDPAVEASVLKILNDRASTRIM